MIRAQFLKTPEDLTFRIEGHAGYDVHGKDIICASVSALSQVIHASMTSKSNDNVLTVIKESKGSMYVNVDNPTNDQVTLYETLLLGMNLLSSQFPDYVEVESEVDTDV
jgi:uncharacterized protein YsxB (DUF464 family)